MEQHSKQQLKKDGTNGRLFLAITFGAQQR
jgi:hypothetical protein